jgi:hypothetical protein
MKFLFHPKNIGLSSLKKIPFLCFQIFQQAKITTSIKKGWLNCCLAADKEDWMS